MRFWSRLAVNGLGLALGLAGLTASAQVNPGQLIQGLDSNSDGVVDRSEVPESARPQFDKVLKLADGNKDSKLDRDELRAMAKKLRDAGPAMRKGAAGSPAAAAIGSPQERFKQMDKDGDGKVTKDEFRGPEALFDRLDADKDGVIAKGELPNGNAPGAPGAGNGDGKAFLMRRLKGMDKDNDGKITREEFTGQPENFDRMDRDGDGSISTKEVEGAVAAFGGLAGGAPKPAPEAGKPAPNGPMAAQRFRRMDANSDGKVTRDEYKGPEGLFDRLDADKDGAVTREELKAIGELMNKGERSTTKKKP